MANTYVKIGSTVTVGVLGAATIDFTSIPATYTDLLIKLSLRSNRTASGARQDNPFLTFNGSATGYTERRLYGDGAAAASASWSSGNIVLGNIPAANATANTFGNMEVYIPNYASANYKSISVDETQEDNQTSAYMEIDAGLWSDTSAITSMSIGLGGASFVQYSTATLYGIKKN